jgi:hypothetical protein
VRQLVREEFAPNRDRIIKDSGRSLSGALKRARVALWTYGDPRRRRKTVDAIDALSTTG